MNLGELIKTIEGSVYVQTMLQHLENKGVAGCSVTGTIGAMHAFLIAAIIKKAANNPLNVVVCKNKEEAAYWQNDVNAILGEQGLLLPDSYKSAMRFEDLNRTAVLQRTDVLGQLINGASKLIFTYPEALFELFVAPASLQKQVIEIEVGHALDLDFLAEVLTDYGFERVDFVYEPGQFAFRGFIVDIYSYGNEYPYRVELFDTEVESIRVFNPATQLSERNISKVNIIPNVNTKFDQKEKVPFFKVLPANTILWVNDWDYLADRLDECQLRVESLLTDVESREIDEDHVEAWNLLKTNAFANKEEVLEGLNTFSQVDFAPKGRVRFPAQLIEMKMSVQPAFGKNFQMLIKDIFEKNASDNEVFIFADNSKQIERFYSIFNDLKANIRWHPIAKTLHSGFIEESLNLVCYTDHQIFERYNRYKIKQGFDQSLALNLKRIKELQPGDYVSHIDHGVGRFSGLEKIEINGHTQEAVRLVYRDNDILYVSINSLHKISRYTGKDGTPPSIHKLGTDTWANLKKRAKQKIRELAFDLIKLYAERKKAKGHAFSPDNYLQTELEASFAYEDTPDQAKACEDVKSDMQKPFPMDRLVCGDVGFGKTEVAIRAAFKAINDGAQVAILVPTTILAFQHFNTFKERFDSFGIKLDYLNRFKSAKEKTEILRKLAAGELELVIGTHALLSDKVKYKNLGLLIIDEEQKFGVGSKEKIRNYKVNVDTLTLTATPIPRTLQFSLMGARDFSVINTPPPNRQPIHTEVRTFNDTILKDTINLEVARGGQVFFLHNRVNQLVDMAALLKRLIPDLKIAVAHGQMDENHLETVLLDFIEGKYDVLVSTNIIETGLDIPNANTIIINNAHHFGLSDLHQLRGRVGRSSRKAYCYLFAPPPSVLTPEAKKRLQTIEEFSDLGSGFQIAMRDLDIRGAGNILGAEQSGFVTDIGYETYQKILEETLRELKNNEYKELYADTEPDDPVRDVNIDTDVEMLIPNNYVENSSERLAIYTELDNIETEEQLAAFTKKITDRFGKLPQPVYELFDGLRLRWICRKLGFERIILKNNKMRCYFPANPQSFYFSTPVFQKLLDHITKLRDPRIQMKQSNNLLQLIIDQVPSLKKAQSSLQEMFDRL